MPFVAGQAPPSNAGRKKGSKTQNPLPEVRKYLKRKGINAIDELVEIAKEAKLDGELDLARKIWAQLASLSYATPVAPAKKANSGVKPPETPEVPGDHSISHLLSVVSQPTNPKPDGGSTS